MAPVMHRLTPFAQLSTENGEITLVAPDTEITLAAFAAGRLRELTNWSPPDELSSQLAELGAVIEGPQPSGPHQLLYRLEAYLRAAGKLPQTVRKGIEGPDLPQPAYRFRVNGVSSEGFGMDKDPVIALVKAAAELYERLSCDIELNGRHILSRPIGAVLRPMRYARWQLDQPDFRYGEEPNGRFLIAHNPVTNEPASVPVEIACYPHYLSPPLCGRGNSSGVAAHTDERTAMLKGIYELIERDALMHHWFRETAGSTIRPPHELQSRVERLEGMGYELRFINLTLEVAPVILLVARRPGGMPNLLLGMGSASSPFDALVKALEEVEASSSFPSLTVERQVELEKVRGVMDHHWWYNRPGNARELDFLWSSPNEIELSQIPAGPATVEEMHRHLARLGMTWHCLSMNPEGYEQTGLHVVRSVVPQLIPITFGYKLEPLGHPRLHDSSGSQHIPRRITPTGYRLQPFA